MTLGEKQALFARLMSIHLLWIDAHEGWHVTLGDGNVDAQVGHMSGSNHYRRLAQDLNLFIEGAYIMDGRHPAWKIIGEAWEGLHPLCRWGGRFQPGYDPASNTPKEFTGKDSNHFSLVHEGRA